MTGSVVKSLLTTLGISAAIAGALVLLGISFWPSFIIVIIMQIIGWQIFQYIVSVNAALKNKEIEESMMKEFISNSASMPCAGCKQENVSLIQLNTTNSFVCTKCGCDNVIYVHLESAQTTKAIKSLNIEDTIKINELK